MMSVLKNSVCHCAKRTANSDFLSTRFQDSVLTDEVFDEMCRFVKTNIRARELWYVNIVKFHPDSLSCRLH